MVENSGVPYVGIETRAEFFRQQVCAKCTESDANQKKGGRYFSPKNILTSFRHTLRKGALDLLSNDKTETVLFSHDLKAVGAKDQFLVLVVKMKRFRAGG